MSFCRDIPRSDYDFKNRDSMQKYILEHGRDFTAIVCERDMVAVSMLYVLQNLGIEVPGQVSVVGYDDLPMASQCKPSLTTVHHNYLEIAHQTVQYFVSRLSGKQTEEPLQKTYIHPIIARESDGPVPR